MARARGERIAIGFMVVWLVVWAAGMMVVLYGLARAVASGEPMAMLLMTLWLGGAGFGLVMGARKLRQLLLAPGAAPRRSGDRPWNDGVREGGRGDRPPPPPQV